MRYDKTDLSDAAVRIREITDNTGRKAARTVARRATDADDLQELLRMLGIMDARFLRPLTPSARWKATPEGAETGRARRRALVAERREETP